MNALHSAIQEQPGSAGCQIRLSGDLNVGHAMDLHRILTSACEKFSHVDILLHDVTAFDVSAIQLLLAASAETATKVVVQTGENSDCVSHWLTVAGLPNVFASAVA
jgi:anti-anti-sigma regulatory factor